MNLEIDQSVFINSLLSPVSKLAENLTLDLKGGEGKVCVSSSDNSLILFVTVPCKSDQEVRCVIPECKTFLRLFSGINQEKIALTLESNFISYSDENISFKYHLLDESYITNKKTISEQKLNELNFETSFNLTKQKLSEIIKYNSIIPDAEKLYLFTKNGKVLAKIGDRQKANTNEIVIEISSSFAGNEISEDFPINIQNILLFSFSTEEIKASLNHQLKLFKFEGPHQKYFVSGLVK
jgi:hypothetical protein